MSNMALIESVLNAQLDFWFTQLDLFGLTTLSSILAVIVHINISYKI